MGPVPCLPAVRYPMNPIWSWDCLLDPNPSYDCLEGPLLVIACWIQRVYDCLVDPTFAYDCLVDYTPTPAPPPPYDCLVGPAPTHV
jgi:hypothetical protein